MNPKKDKIENEINEALNLLSGIKEVPLRKPLYPGIKQKLFSQKPAPLPGISGLDFIFRYKLAAAFAVLLIVLNVITFLNLSGTGEETSAPRSKYIEQMSNEYFNTNQYQF